MLYARHAVYPARRVVRLNAHATRAGAGAHGARPRGAPGGPGPGLIFLIARRLAPHPAPAGREMPKSHTDNYKDSKKSPGTFLHAPGGSRPARHAWQARSGTAKVNRTPRDRTAQLSGAERTAGTRARRYHAAAAARTADAPRPHVWYLYMPSMCVAQASEVRRLPRADHTHTQRAPASLMPPYPGAFGARTLRPCCSQLADQPRPPPGVALRRRPLPPYASPPRP